MEIQLKPILEITVSLFAAASMFSVGLAHSFKEIIYPLRNTRLVLSAIVCNFVLVPCLAYLITYLLILDEPIRVGLFLLATASGAPFLIKLTVIAQNDLATSTALLALLLATTVIYMPVVIPLLVPGAAISSVTIALTLLWTMLLPLALGLILREWRPIWSIRLQPITGHVSSASLISLILLTVVIHYQSILGIFGSGAILAGLLLTIGAFVIGYFAVQRKSGNRVVLGLATSQRNIAAATVIATQDFDHPDVLMMVIVTSLLALLILFPLALSLGKRSTNNSLKQLRQN